MKKHISILLSTVFIIGSIFPVQAATPKKISDDFLAPLVESGLYKVDNVEVISPSKEEITLLNESDEPVAIEVEKSEGVKIYTFAEKDVVTEVKIAGDKVYLNGEPVTVSVKTQVFDSSVVFRATSENWISDIKPFDSGKYGTKAAFVKDINIKANQTIGALSLTALLALVSAPVASGLATLVADIGTFSELKDALEALQKKAPDTKGLYQRETYYKSSQEDTSGRPITYYYKVKLQYAKTQEFKTFYPESAYFYRKQMIYA